MYVFQKFVGKADVLHEELMSHFEHFGKHLKDIREVDNELCHHTYAAGWKVMIIIRNIALVMTLSNLYRETDHSMSV